MYKPRLDVDVAPRNRSTRGSCLPAGTLASARKALGAAQEGDLQAARGVPGLVSAQAIGWARLSTVTVVAQPECNRSFCTQWPAAQEDLCR